MPHDLFMPEDKAAVSSNSTGQNSRYSSSHTTYLAAIRKIPETLSAHKRLFMKGHDLIHEDQQRQNAYVLHSGWACSYRILHDGTRQIINFHIPGDLVGIRQLITAASDESICAITSVEAEEFSIDDLSIALRSDSCLAISILWSALRDEAIITQHLVDVGRRRPINRAAHLFLELGSRLNPADLDAKTEYECPLTQSLIADALGLTAVHFNRVLRQLRELNAMTFHEGWVEFLDEEKLRRLADFDPSYLL
jgi:CRP-like cAMP-binding protein